MSSANHATLNSTAPCIQRSLGDHTVSHCTDLCDTAHSLFKHYGMYEFAFHGERSINRTVLDFPIGLPQAPAPLDEAVSTADWLVNNPPPVNADAETAAADDSDSSVSSLNDAVPSSHTQALLDSLGHMYTGSACWLSCAIPVSLTKSLHCHFLLSTADQARDYVTAAQPESHIQVVCSTFFDLLFSRSLTEMKTSTATQCTPHF